MADMSTDTVLLRLSFERWEDQLKPGIKLPNLVVIHGESQYPGFRQALVVTEGTAVVKTATDHHGFDFVIETENDFFAISNDYAKISDAALQRIHATPKSPGVVTMEDTKYNPYQGSDNPEKTWHIFQCHKLEGTMRMGMRIP